MNDSGLHSPRRKSGRHFDSPQQEVFLNLWRTYDRLKALEEALFTRHGLSAQQYNALRLLRSASPGAMQTLELGERLISRAPDMTRLLDKLERRNLIARQRRADNRRVVEVRITPEGLRLLDEMASAVRDMHFHQLGHLSAADLDLLVDLLKLARHPHEDDTCDWLDTPRRPLPPPSPNGSDPGSSV